MARLADDEPRQGFLPTNGKRSESCQAILTCCNLTGRDGTVTFRTLQERAALVRVDI